jgi:hypothetical protein
VLDLLAVSRVYAYHAETCSASAAAGEVAGEPGDSEGLMRTRSRSELGEAGPKKLHKPCHTSTKVNVHALSCSRAVKIAGTLQRMLQHGQGGLMYLTYGSRLLRVRNSHCICCLIPTAPQMPEEKAAAVQNIIPIIS